MSRDWRNQFPSRRGLFLAGGGIAFAALTARLAELQIFRAGEFDSKAEENRIRLEPAPAHRGTIYDRRGVILAGSKRSFYVTIRPEAIKVKGGTVADVLDRLGTVLKLGDERKRSIINEANSRASFEDITVADDLTWEEFSAVNVMAPELEGVRAEVGELRSYPRAGAFYHTIGYVQKANDADIMRVSEADMKRVGLAPDTPEGKARMATIKRLYKHPQMRVGKVGLERYADAALTGEAGKQRVEVNASGRVIAYRPSDDLAGKPGAETVLAVDAELQTFAIQRFGNEAGSAVIIDVASGEVMCMMSTPAPDPNQFVSGIGRALYKSYQEDIRNPLYHKAYEGLYPPGSTFKVVVAAAALESGIVKPEDRVLCRGSAYYYDRSYACWEPKGHGWMNLHSGLANSCDCYFYAIAQRIEIERIAEMAKNFGMAHRYDLGITGGRAGVAPNDEWKRAQPLIRSQWWPGDTISAAIGQGYVLASPFELAVMTARVAGGPTTPNPKFVVSGFDVPDQAIRPLQGVSPRTMDLIRAGMAAVTSAGGTAVRSGLLDEKNEFPAPYTGARMAGKSGTAQVRAIKQSERDASGKALGNEHFEWKLRDHALFVAYAPIENPRYACAVIVEHGVSGSRTAAPIAKDLLAHCLRHDPGAKKPFVPQEQEVATVEKART